MGMFEPFGNTETIAVIEPLNSTSANAPDSVSQPDVKVPSGNKVDSTSKTVPIDLFSAELTSEQKQELQQLIDEFGDIVAVDKTDLGFTDLVQYRTDVGGNLPTKSKPYRVPFSQRPIIEEQIKTMLEKNIIRPSTSPWSSNVVPVAKKDGSRRFCIDYRKLNKITRKETYGLPRIDETLDALGNAQYFSTLDLAAGYWQIGMASEHIDKTAITTITGHFEFLRMPFGLGNAAPRCQQLMDFLLAGLQWQICLYYLDNIIIYSRTFSDHLSNLRTVFEWLRAAGLKVRLQKCTFGRSEVPYLGHIISKEGIKADPAKIAVVRNYQVPTTVKEVRQFIGLAWYYRRFIRNFASIAAPLHKLTNKYAHFVWSLQCQETFDSLCQSLISAPILRYLDFSLPFIVYTDASDTGVGAVC